MSQLDDALHICTALEMVAPRFNAHVALTGGVLYKDGERKDIDIMFYRVRQKKQVDEPGLLDAIDKMGFKLGKRKGWVQKASYQDYSIDFLFPNTDDHSKSFTGY